MKNLIENMPHGARQWFDVMRDTAQARAELQRVKEHAHKTMSKEMAHMQTTFRLEELARCKARLEFCVAHKWDQEFARWIVDSHLGALKFIPTDGEKVIEIVEKDEKENSLG